jgi:hypothetical protein
MRDLTIDEIDAVSGGIFKSVKEGFSGWLVGKIADGVVDWVASLNQGGSPNGTTAMGDNY